MHMRLGHEDLRPFELTQNLYRFWFEAGERFGDDVQCGIMTFLRGTDPGRKLLLPNGREIDDFTKETLRSLLESRGILKALEQHTTGGADE